MERDAASLTTARRWALGLFAGALALRLVHLLTIRDSPFFSILYIDPRMYDEWGLRIAGGQLLSDKPFFLDPLYPYMLGAIYAVFGHSYTAVLVVQSLLGALVPPLVYLASRRWFDEPTSRAAGIIATIYIPGIYFGALMMKPGLAMFLVAVVLWLLSRAFDEPKVPRWTWAVAGLVFGMACLTRGNLVLTIPVVALFVWLRGSGPRVGWQSVSDRGRWTEAGLFVTGTSLLLVLSLWHNWTVGRELILTTANAGANFYIGNNSANKTGEYQQLPFIDANPQYEQRDFRRAAERKAGRELSDREVSRFWFGETWSWIRENPGDWAWLLGRKVRSFWGAYEIPDSLDYYLYREYAPVLRLPIPGFGLLAPLALLGAVLALRRPGWPRLLLVFLATYAATVVFFFVFSRFRMVAALVLYVFAAHGLIELARALRLAAADRERRRRALAPAGLLLAFFAFVNLPVRARTHTWGYRVASAIGLPTQAESSALGHHNLGLAYAKKAKVENESELWLERARQELEIALQDEHDHARVHVEMGKVLARMKRNTEAIEIYREAATLEPNDYAIHHALGILHRRERQLEPAARAFSHALQLAPKSRASAKSLGNVLLQLDRPAEAERAFGHALRLSPDDAEAQAGVRAARERMAGTTVPR